jgi:hypothetical protein
MRLSTNVSELSDEALDGVAGGHKKPHGDCSVTIDFDVLIKLLIKVAQGASGKPPATAAGAPAAAVTRTVVEDLT